VNQRGNDFDAASARPALRRRADRLLAGQKEALELALSGSALSAVLETLVRTVEVLGEPDLLASILWLDDDGLHLRDGAGASLPSGFRQALDGLEAGTAAAGPNGAALSRLEAVNAPDLSAQRGEWPAFRALALAHGLRACWATPIVGQGRHTLGVLALYRHQPREPSADETALAEEIVHTAALLLERDVQERRRAREDRHRDDFLATLVHELRNPLAPLRNALELMVRGDAGVVERARSIMSRQVLQLARLIDELADLSQSARSLRLAHDDSGETVQLALPVDGADNMPHDGTRRVLVADDNQLVRESFVELLRSEGYEVLTAADGVQAVELAEQWHPQVVLLDIHMPRLSGIETARRLRALHPRQAMSLLMMSGITLNDAWLRHAKAAGFDDCIDKSADPHAWLDLVRRSARAVEAS
jgi:CheY-like chemotaxis protein